MTNQFDSAKQGPDVDASSRQAKRARSLSGLATLQAQLVLAGMAAALQSHWPASLFPMTCWADSAGNNCMSLSGYSCSLFCDPLPLSDRWASAPGTVQQTTQAMPVVITLTGASANLLLGGQLPQARSSGASIATPTSEPCSC